MPEFSVLGSQQLGKPIYPPPISLIHTEGKARQGTEEPRAVDVCTRRPVVKMKHTINETTTRNNKNTPSLLRGWCNDGAAMEGENRSKVVNPAHTYYLLHSSIVLYY